MCTEKTFWGNCNKDDVCVCYNTNWYNTTITAITEEDTAVRSFTDICTCDNSEYLNKCN